jgi:hypothetical protein
MHDCIPDPKGQYMNTPVDLPPVFPVVNAVLGFQIRPSKSMEVNIEGGLHSFPFFGISGVYLFR